jgi:hypothetical protein
VVAPGILSVIRTGAIAGFWLVAVGLHLRQAAGATGARLAVRRALEHVPVRVAVAFGSACVPAHTTAADLVRDHPSTEGIGGALSDTGPRLPAHLRPGRPGCRAAGGPLGSACAVAARRRPDIRAPARGAFAYNAPGGGS